MSACVPGSDRRSAHAPHNPACYTILPSPAIPPDHRVGVVKQRLGLRRSQHGLVDQAVHIVDKPLELAHGVQRVAHDKLAECMIEPLCECARLLLI